MELRVRRNSLSGFRGEGNGSWVEQEETESRESGVCGRSGTDPDGFSRWTLSSRESASQLDLLSA